jgi:hypothetical protein
MSETAPATRPRREYSDDDKAAALTALAANNGNVKGTARLCGIPPKTLESWAKGKGLSPAVPPLCEFKKGTLAQKLESVLHLLLDSIPDDPASIRKAGVRDRMIAVGVAVDKRAALGGDALTFGPRVKVQMDMARLVDRVYAKVQKAVAEQGETFTRQEIAARMAEHSPQYAHLYELAQEPCPLCGAPAEARPLPEDVTDENLTQT